MLQEPNLDKAQDRDDPIDTSWAAIVLDRFNRYAARRWLSAQAFAAGLAEDHSLPRQVEPPKKGGTVSIDQTLSFSLSDLQSTSDGRVTVRQSFELSSERCSQDDALPPAPAITQTPRVLWLRGPEALGRSRMLVQKLKDEFGPIAAAVPVYQVKGDEQRYAIDPWLVEIRLDPQTRLPADIRNKLERPWTPRDDDDCDDKQGSGRRLDESVRLYGGNWLAAQFRTPVEDSRKFAREFYDQVRSRDVILGYRSLPLTVRSASIPLNDRFYADGPFGTAGQDETLALLRAPAMWNRIESVTTPRSPVHVFLFDLGADAYGADLPVHEEHSVNAIGQPPVIPLPMGDFAPWGGDRHGRQMASVMGARWAAVSADSMAGVFGKFYEISIVSVRCQTLAEMTNGLAHVTWFMSTRPAGERAVAVFGNDLLHACATSPTDAAGIKYEVVRFKAALQQAQLTGPGKADLLAVVPAGNYLTGASPGIPGDLFPHSAATVVVGACGLPPGTALMPGSRYEDPPGTGFRPCLVAPGQNIIAASTGSIYTHVSGTSFAAAHVAGVAALMRMVDTASKTASQIGDILRGSCSSLGTAKATTPDGKFGAGRLDGEAAALGV